MAISDFLFHGDYPIDQVVYMTSGSFSIAGGGGLGTLSQFPHSKTFRPLVIGTWSTDPNFTTSKEGGFFTFDGTDPNALYVDFFANDTTITVSGYNPTAPAVTVYYRIYGFMPSNINVDATATASLADIFSFNPDHNYPKLLLNDIAPAAATTTVTHSLGYRPQVIAWIKDSTIYGTTAIIDKGFVKVNINNVVITSPSNDVHYRIYADPQL